MKTILVPTDFSAGAFSAARYAAALARQKGWQLALCNAFQPFFSGFQGDSQNKADKEQATALACEQMGRFVQMLQPLYPEVSIHADCVIGTLDELIGRQAREKGAHLIVMGTRGATGPGRVLFGSHTYDAIRQAVLPVLAVPGRLKTCSLDKVGFATNYRAAEVVALQDFMELMDDSLEVVPFHLYRENRKEEEQRMAEWESKVKKMVSFPIADFQLVVSRNYPAAISRFIKKQKLDALVMTCTRKDILDRLFHKDLIRAEAHHLPAPVLFMKE